MVLLSAILNPPPPPPPASPKLSSLSMKPVPSVPFDALLLAEFDPIPLPRPPVVLSDPVLLVALLPPLPPSACTTIL